MNERERWIVYPLLFFALGAALRDKFFKQIDTGEIQCKRLVAKQIACDEINVVDSANPERIVAKLLSASPQGGEDKGERFGALVLFDSEGKELCNVTNNQLYVGQIACKEAYVLDPENPRRHLALLTSTVTTAPDKSTHRMGTLLLNDDSGAQLFGLVNNQLRIPAILCNGLICNGLAVVSPDAPTEVLAQLGSAIEKPEGGGAPSRIGLFELNKQRFSGIRGNPVQIPINPSAADSAPPSSQSTPAPAEPPAK